MRNPTPVRGTYWVAEHVGRVRTDQDGLGSDDRGAALVDGRALAWITSLVVFSGCQPPAPPPPLSPALVAMPDGSLVALARLGTTSGHGNLFDNLIRRFNELANETAGDHFTPREVIRLMVNLLFIHDDKLLVTAGRVRKLLDPACGTGGMLAEAQRYLREHNTEAKLYACGQDYNKRAFATTSASATSSPRTSSRPRPSTTSSATRPSASTGRSSRRGSRRSTKNAASTAGSVPACRA